MKLNKQFLALLSWTTLVAACFSVSTAQAAEESIRVYIGTYTRGESEGIYQLTLDRATGSLSAPTLAVNTENPSFLALHPKLTVLYAAGEMSDGGTVSAFDIDPKSGLLTKKGSQSSEGRGPCHVSVSPDSAFAAVANYGSGSVALFTLGTDGQIEAAVDTAQHAGSSVNERRQQGPHAHSVNFDAKGQYLFAADLGIDQVVIYKILAGKLVPNDPPYVSLAPGAGPRHFSFHPSGRFAYSINELDSTVTAFAYDGEKGVLTPLQTVDTLPEDFDGDNTTAEIRVHPSGKFVYASNRGHDSIAAFAADADSGKLTPIGHTSSGGETPRNFNIDPSGGYLLAANQKTDNVIVLKIHPENGTLTPTGHDVSIPSPVCVVFVPSAHPAAGTD